MILIVCVHLVYYTINLTISCIICKIRSKCIILHTTHEFSPGLMLWQSVSQLLDVFKVFKQFVTHNSVTLTVNLWMERIKIVTVHFLTFITIAWFEVSRRKRNFSSWNIRDVMSSSCAVGQGGHLLKVCMEREIFKTVWPASRDQGPSYRLSH